MRIVPDIPVVFDGKFPRDYVNDVADWAFPREELEANKGRMLTMDIDFTLVGQCSLNCGHCYSHNGFIDQGENPPLSFEEQVSVLEQGKALGLRSAKLLGRGEHTEHPRFLEFLEQFQRLGIVPLVFTKGHVIGDDELVEKYHGDRGIYTGQELVSRLDELNARILLGFRSFDTAKEDRDVGDVEGYSKKRNRALELLVEQKFNQHHPTHIGLMALPVKQGALDDAFEIYTWGKERNMYVCVAPSMFSGRGRDQTDAPSPEELTDLYTNIYDWNIDRGVQTLDQIREEGISAYAGSRPCQQVGTGVYITLFGDVYICPGDDSPNVRFGNVREQSLKEIWEASPNFQRAGTFNFHCPAKDGRTIPDELYGEVLRRVEEGRRNKSE